MKMKMQRTNSYTGSLLATYTNKTTKGWHGGSNDSAAIENQLQLFEKNSVLLHKVADAALTNYHYLINGLSKGLPRSRDDD